MFETGFWTLFYWRKIPIRAHWSLPIGMWWFSGMSLDPLAWVALALLILWHELGHAFLVRRYRYPVVSVDLTGFGGLCRYSGSPTAWQNSVIAWGGVLAQALIFVAASTYQFFIGVPSTAWAHTLLWVATTANLRLIAFNLLPLPPLDGADAWRLVGLWWRARKNRRADALPVKLPDWRAPLGKPPATEIESDSKLASKNEDPAWLKMKAMLDQAPPQKLDDDPNS